MPIRQIKHIRSDAQAGGRVAKVGHAFSHGIASFGMVLRGFVSLGVSLKKTEGSGC